MRPNYGIQTVGGLVEDEQFRFRRESDVEPKQLAHALGIRSNLACERQFEDSLQSPHVLIYGAAVQSRVEPQNLKARHVWIEREVLGYEPDTPAEYHSFSGRGGTENCE